MPLNFSEVWGIIKWTERFQQRICPFSVIYIMASDLFGQSVLRVFTLEYPRLNSTFDILGTICSVTMDFLVT